MVCHPGPLGRVPFCLTLQTVHVAVAELQARTADVEAAARKRAAAAKQYKEVRSLRLLGNAGPHVASDSIGTPCPRPRMVNVRLTRRMHPVCRLSRKHDA